jgi:small basic protein
MAENERQSLLRDLWRETAESWGAMSLAARTSFVAGLIGFVVFNWFAGSALPSMALSGLRVASLIALLAGAIANARALDEFYQRVYLLACAYTLVAACVIVYALSEFGVNLGSHTIAVFVAVWGVSFVTSFAVLRNG